MPEVVDARAFGALESEVAALKGDIQDLRGEVRELTRLIQQVKGGWAVMAWLVGFAVAISGLALAAWKMLVGR